MDDVDVKMMRLAIEQAQLAQSEGEVPVGAVLTFNNEVLSLGRNQNITLCDPSAHAEMLAIREGALALNNHRLLGTTLYVTLEPCSMCAGLLIHSRIKRLVYAAKDPKTGACGSISNLVSDGSLNHTIEVVSGMLEQECSVMLSAFFKERRTQQKAQKLSSEEKGKKTS